MGGFPLFSRDQFPLRSGDPNCYYLGRGLTTVFISKTLPLQVVTVAYQQNDLLGRGNRLTETGVVRFPSETIKMRTCEPSYL